MNKKRFILIAPYLVMYIVLLVLFWFWPLGLYDDAHYALHLFSGHYFTDVLSGYKIWTSGIFIDAVSYIFAGLPHIFFRIFAPFFVTLLSFFIADILKIKNNPLQTGFLSLLLCLFPWQFFSGAGYIVSFCGYILPSVAVFAAFVPIAEEYRCIQNDKIYIIKPFAVVVTTVLMIYGTNLMLLAGMGLLLLTALLCYYLIYRKKISYLVPLLLAVCAFAVFFALVSPGNAARADNEIVMNFQDYNMQNLLQRLQITLVLTVRELFFEGNILFLTSCTAISVSVFLQEKNRIYRILSTIPVAALLIFNMVSPLSGIGVFSDMLKYIPINVTNAAIQAVYLPVVTCAMLLIVCTLNIYIVFGHSKAAAISVVAFICGFASRAVLAFSPSVAASGPRTSTFFILIIAAITTAAVSRHKGTVLLC